MKIVGCQCPLSLLGDADLMWYSHNSCLKGQQTGQWEHSVHNLNISFVGVLCTSETHAYDQDTHVMSSQHLGSS